jgi:ATP-dependent protease Clp ATPase subunit
MFGQQCHQKEIPRCSFCNKSHDQVDALISNPSERSSRVVICNQCIAVCNLVLEEHQRSRTKAATVEARLKAAVLEEHKNAEAAGATVVGRLKAFAGRP